ncbi:cupin domain-containing protein [Caenispirillum salinarum]
MSFDVGARLKALRALYGLSQRELAKRAGVTNSTISLIEQNRVSPSVASLKKVLDGLPIALAEFFTMDLGQENKTFYGADEFAAFSFGDTIDFRMVGGSYADRKLHMMQETYRPGGDTGEPLLSYEGEEAGIVISGTIELTVGAESRQLSAGEGYYFSTAEPHRFRNTTGAPCVLISASTTTTFHKGQAASGQPLDAAEAPPAMTNQGDATP